jgi:hypothetical protein
MILSEIYIFLCVDAAVEFGKVNIDATGSHILYDRNIRCWAMI